MDSRQTSGFLFSFLRLAIFSKLKMRGVERIYDFFFLKQKGMFFLTHGCMQNFSPITGDNVEALAWHSG